MVDIHLVLFPVSEPKTEPPNPALRIVIYNECWNISFLCQNIKMLVLTTFRKVNYNQ